MRRFPWMTTAVLASLLLAAPSVLAEEGEAPEPPPYSAEDMVSKDLPEGWAICPTPPAGAPTEDALMTLGEAVGLDEDTLFVESRVIKKDDAVAVIALVDIDSSPDAFRALIDKSAEAGGWVVKELGSPMRPLVVSAPAAETAEMLAGWARNEAVYQLADAGWEKLQERSMEGYEAGMKLVNSARTIEPKAGVVAAILGFIQLQQNKSEALAAWKHSLDADAPVPPRGRLRVMVGFQFGQALLESADDDVLPLALAVLEDAVKNEKALDFENSPQDAHVVFGNRYNLACAFARLDRIDEAFTALEKSLVLAKAKLGDRYRAAWEHCQNTDPDMDSLKADERFEPLMEKLAPVEGTDG